MSPGGGSRHAFWHQFLLCPRPGSLESPASARLWAGVFAPSSARGRGPLRAQTRGRQLSQAKDDGHCSARQRPSGCGGRDGKHTRRAGPRTRSWFGPHTRQAFNRRKLERTSDLPPPRSGPWRTPRPGERRPAPASAGSGQRLGAGVVRLGSAGGHRVLGHGTEVFQKEKA